MRDDERRILAFVGAHPFVFATQVARAPGLSGDSSAELVSGLIAGGLVRKERLLAAGAPLLRITTSGLAAIESQMSAPGFDLGDVRGELAAVSVWVAAWEGVFGNMSRVLSRRELDALDRRAVQAGSATSGFALRRDGRIRYPRVAMVSHAGHRIAVELLLWPWRAFEPEPLLVAYRDQLDLDAVLVLVDSEHQIEWVKAAAAGVDMADRVHVRRLPGPRLRSEVSLLG